MAQNAEDRMISTFFVSNVHCSSCVAYITHVLSDISGIRDINVSILTHEVRVVHTADIDPVYIAKSLIHAAFEVHHVATRDSTGGVISEIETFSLLPRESGIFTSLPASSPAPRGNRHFENCDACRQEELKQTLTPTGPDPKSQTSKKANTTTQETETLREERPAPLPPQESLGKFSARISIEGMSCASCVNSITNEVAPLDFVEDITVTLLSNTAMIVYRGAESNIEKVIQHIEDIGFGASVDEVNQVIDIDSTHSQDSQIYIAEVAIGGMTCGSCAGAITQGLEDLPFVTNISVNLIANNGKVEFEGRENVSAIIEKIEDLGYDASITSVNALSTEADKSVIEKRIVLYHIDGMFCHHCPEKVINSLKDLPGVDIDTPLSVKNPIAKVTYTPSSAITVRSIRQTIESAHSTFRVTVYHPPSIEDRSRAMQIHERRRLLSRFLFVLLVAIPTFIIGIVFMSLVPSNNRVRQYLEQSVWSGSVSRIEWALFIMTTPVMFYGTDVFHVRAAKEIISLWRPGSRVPILRRLYRFGSMNLLISMGTVVAYVSSLAVLIVDAVNPHTSSTHNTTYFDTVVFLTLFILAGRYIEAYSKARAGDAVASLGKLRPSDALLVVKGSDFEEELESSTSLANPNEVQRISVDLLEIGDIVRVPHGTSPPADGRIIGAGSYQFDESSLTGESRPVHKTNGDQVYTGSVNVGQPVEFKITAVGGASMLDQIIDVVREGQSRRAPLERVADVLVAHFVPAITLIAVLTFIIWVSLGSSGRLPSHYLDTDRGGWAFWSLEFAIAVFVVACPCGLALAAPTALFVGGGLAAHCGILVKGGGEAFQEASHLNAIVFDKTGTITEGGSLKVSDFEALTTDSESLQIAWTLARALEESSNHPIACAIAEFSRHKSTAYVVSSDIEEKSGQGMRGLFTLSIEDSTDHKKTCRYEAAIGNQRFIQSLASPDFDHYYLNNILSRYQTAGKSTAILSLRALTTSDSDKANPFFSPAIVFAVSDSIRADAAMVISKLQQRKINVFMCTGDNEATAHAVADMVGIPRTNVMAGVMPSEKADFVRQIQAGQRAEQLQIDLNNQPRPVVAFVGDGVNDSPALAVADVSIAMASGSDVAMNSASFILLNSELGTILQLVQLSRRVINRIKMNFGWAVVYNLCLVPVAAGVFYPIVSGHKTTMVNGEMTIVDKHWRLSPVWAALAMALSSISVVSSSLALAIEKKTIRKFLFMTQERRRN